MQTDVAIVLSRAGHGERLKQGAHRIPPRPRACGCQAHTREAPRLTVACLGHANLGMRTPPRPWACGLGHAIVFFSFRIRGKFKRRLRGVQHPLSLRETSPRETRPRGRRPEWRSWREPAGCQRIALPLDRSHGRGEGPQSSVKIAMLAAW